MISLAKIKQGTVLEYFEGTEDELHYGSNTPEETLIVHFPEWAKEVRIQNEKAGVALRLLEWSYDLREFIIKDFRVNWDGRRIAHANRTREIRNKMLAFTDWIETTNRLDPAIKEKMLDYRQQLRDAANCPALSSAENFEQWCTSNNREPFPFEFIPEKDEDIAPFFIGLDIVF
jgi:hypothetical protein